MNVAWVVLHCNRRIGAKERRQLIPHVRFQVPFLGPESQLKSGFACAGLLCSSLDTFSHLDPSHRRFHCCLTTSVATRRCRLLASKCSYCELLCLDGLLYVISGILAGDPWFPHSLGGMVMCFLCFRFLFCLVFCHTNTWVDTMLSPHLLHWSLNCRSLSTLLVSGVFCFVCLVFVLFLVAFGVVWLFAVFLQWIVTAAGLCTGPIPVHFCIPHTWWRLFVCIN